MFVSSIRTLLSKPGVVVLNVSNGWEDRGWIWEGWDGHKGVHGNLYLSNCVHTTYCVVYFYFIIHIIVVVFVQIQSILFINPNINESVALFLDAIASLEFEYECKSLC